MKQEILKIFLEKGFLLDKEMLEFLNELADEEVAHEILNKIAVISKQKLITKSLVDKNIEKIKPVFRVLDSQKKKILEKFFVNISISVEIKKETTIDPNNSLSEPKNMAVDESCGNVKVLSSPIIASQKLVVRDFVKHFRNRYNFLKGILQQKPELDNLTAIDKISGNNRNFSIIGIVSDKRITKNKNLILEVEDLTGTIKVLINQNKEELFEKSKEILLDDIIGFKCSGSRDFLYVDDFFYPDSFQKERHRLDEDVYALFTSDFHIGSQNFLEKNLERFINWLGGKDCNETQKNLLKKIKYLFVVGDTIDGVGIYPGQEKDLKIKDIRKQYVRLSEFYKKIPPGIQIIQCAGQHDAVRVAEPQPPVGSDFAEPLQDIENLHLVSNPSLIEIGAKIDSSGNEKPGIKVLMYHGASMHNVINEIEELRVSNAHSTPAKVVRHLLLRRHLAPTHGATVYIPDKTQDPMLIHEVPDIITTGDLHKTDIDKYNGILIISNSCWQSMTAFEEKVGNQPDPCKVPLLNLRTGEIKILDFSELEEEESLENVENSEKKVEGCKIDAEIVDLKNEKGNNEELDIKNEKEGGKVLEVKNE